MNKEIEAKFININKEETIAKLLSLGATEVFNERHYRRGIFMFEGEDPGTWARVRDEGDKVTMAYKRVLSEDLDGVEEIELVINDFEQGMEFLRALRLQEKAYQESRRMRFEVAEEHVVFDIDTWPGLNPLIEIEAKSEETVTRYASLLGFNWKDAMFGSIDLVYEKLFNIPSGWLFDNCPRLEFNNLPDELR